MKNTNIMKYLVGGGLVFALAVFFYLSQSSRAQLGEGRSLDSQPTEVEVIPETKKELFPIEAGDTYGVLMARTGLNQDVINKIYAAAKEVYDLAKIRAGYSIELISGYEAGELREVVYKIDTEQELVVRPLPEGKFSAEVRPIPYETRIVVKEGEISSSLYEAAMSQGIDERAVVALGETFQWTIDFAMDPRVGDTFRFIYEERYLDGNYERPGKILAGKYINAGKPYSLFYFDDGGDNKGFYDEEGNSVQKIFLKAPVAFKYISSGFTTGQRYIKAFNVSTGHRAIDYAAPSGTPIRTVGDGTVTFAGWNGSYGYMVSVRHNGTYSTNYAHMSKMAVKKGAKVKQGEVIGYVGSTGFSTGPHLHYEMVKNGVKINPLAEVLPPGEALKDEARAIFLERITAWREELDEL